MVAHHRKFRIFGRIFHCTYCRIIYQLFHPGIHHCIGISPGRNRFATRCSKYGSHYEICKNSQIHFRNSGRRKFAERCIIINYFPVRISRRRNRTIHLARSCDEFFMDVIGGAGIGLLIAWFFVQAHKRLPTDAPSDIALTLIEPYLMYWIAEQFHSSGVMAVVCGGLYMSSKRLIFLNSASRIRGYSVWESFVFILNGIVFLIIGLELPEIVAGIRSEGIPLATAIGYGLLVTAILIGARMISSYFALIATLIFRPTVAPRASSNKMRFLMPLMLGWTGMRGVVSLAAALAIPVTVSNGEPFPHRNLILFITFVVILVTLLVQGLTLPIFIKKMKFFDDLIIDENEESTKLQKKQGLKQHVYEVLKEKYENKYQGNVMIERTLKQWEERAKTADESWMNAETKQIFVEILESQREYLTQLNEDPKINEEIIRNQLYQIDLEEERLKII